MGEPIMGILVNLLCIIVLGSSLLFLKSQRHYKWVDDNYNLLNGIVWILYLLAIYFFILPMYNMQPNSDWHYRNNP